MPIYNVTTAVVALVRADSEEAAIAKLTRIIDGAGMSVYDIDTKPNAFESEPLGEGGEDFVL